MTVAEQNAEDERKYQEQVDKYKEMMNDIRRA